MSLSFLPKEITLLICEHLPLKSIISLSKCIHFIVPRQNDAFWERSFNRMYKRYTRNDVNQTNHFKTKKTFDAYEHLANINNSIILSNQLNTITHINTDIYPFIVFFVRSPCKKKNVSCYAHVSETLKSVMTKLCILHYDIFLFNDNKKRIFFLHSDTKILHGDMYDDESISNLKIQMYTQMCLGYTLINSDM